MVRIVTINLGVLMTRLTSSWCSPVCFYYPYFDLVSLRIVARQTAEESSN